MQYCNGKLAIPDLLPEPPWLSFLPPPPPRAPLLTPSPRVLWQVTFTEAH